MRIRQSRKKGDMGYLDFFMLGFGSMVGVGWAVSSNHWIAQAGGPIPAFLGFIIATLLLIPIGLCHGELLATLPQGRRRLGLHQQSLWEKFILYFIMVLGTFLLDDTSLGGNLYKHHPRKFDSLALKFKSPLLCSRCSHKSIFHPSWSHPSPFIIFYKL